MRATFRLKLILLQTFGLVITSFVMAGFNQAPIHVVLRGTVVDADTGRPLPCRLYIQAEQGNWHFPRSASSEGSAVAYRRQRSDKSKSVEMHSTLSAHPFTAELPPGRYTLTVERGKEYLPFSRQMTLDKEPVDISLPLKRWVSIQERKWFSGDTHVHRSLEELPNVMLAEDLNVAFPLLYWVTEAFAPPKAGPRSPKADVAPGVIAVDPTHVIYPLNTEYEIFSVNKKPHMLGAFFGLNHRTVLSRGVPPIKQVAEQIHQEGGLIEMDKHNWPWSMALVPIVKPDLYELANNHMWRTDFAFSDWAEPPPDYMQVERSGKGVTERGWIDYTLRNYYALLNCGFRLRPTAGTASGVHPVPLGFGRVYVHCPEGFSYPAWLRGLNEGRSFVTTGPMLLVEVNGQHPGHTFKLPQMSQEFRVQGTALSAQPLATVEIIVNGEVVRRLTPQNDKLEGAGHGSSIDEQLKVVGSSWLAIRCFEEREGRRVRFAHTGPIHIDVADKPLRPRKAEIEFLIRRVEEQLARSRDVLPEAALAEYREALAAYRRIADNAR